MAEAYIVAVGTTEGKPYGVGDADGEAEGEAVAWAPDMTSRLRPAEAPANATSSETPRRKAANSFMPDSSPRAVRSNGLWRRTLPRSAAVLCLALACLTGCSMSVKPLTPSRATIEQIGLPTYPGARPLSSHESNQAVAMMHIHQLDIDFVSSDPFDKIVAYYQARLPRTAQRIVVPMGFASDVTYQFYQGPFQKQVMIMSMKDMRLISLRAVQLFQTPAPSASHS
jgi:hypothetical protein